MSTDAMKLALEALKQIDEAMPFPVAKLAQAALREALAEQPAQQEPVAEAMARYLRVCSSGGMPKKLQESVQSLVNDAERLGYFKAAPQPAQQKPVAWLVYENWRKHSLFFTKEGAEDFKNASQRNDDLSGNLARWKTEPLYTSPPAQRKPLEDE